MHTKNHVAPSSKTGEPEKVNFIPANPILPKMVLNEPKQPPECPLSDIKFVQINKFKRFKD